MFKLTSLFLCHFGLFWICASLLYPVKNRFAWNYMHFSSTTSPLDSRFRPAFWDHHLLSSCGKSLPQFPRDPHSIHPSVPSLCYCSERACVLVPRLSPVCLAPFHLPLGSKLTVEFFAFSSYYSGFDWHLLWLLLFLVVMVIMIMHWCCSCSWWFRSLLLKIILMLMSLLQLMMMIAMCNGHDDNDNNNCYLP